MMFDNSFAQVSAPVSTDYPPDTNFGETGTKQSPINLTGSFSEATGDAKKLAFTYTDTPAEPEAIIERDSTTGMIFVRCSFGTVTYQNTDFKNYGFFIHYPSEHTFGDNQDKAEVEIQLAHKSDDGRELMIALLFDQYIQPTKPQFELRKHGVREVGAPHVENRFITALDLNRFTVMTAQVKTHLPTVGSNLSMHKLLSMDPFEEIEPGVLDETSDEMTIQKAFEENYYVSYKGSLTYEPFTEGV